MFYFFGRGGVLENFDPKKGGVFENFDPKKGGVFENFDAKKGGVFENFRGPPPQFCRGGGVPLNNQRPLKLLRKN